MFKQWGEHLPSALEVKLHQYPRDLLFETLRAAMESIAFKEQEFRIRNAKTIAMFLVLLEVLRSGGDDKFFATQVRIGFILLRSFLPFLGLEGNLRETRPRCLSVRLQLLL